MFWWVILTVLVVVGFSVVLLGGPMVLGFLVGVILPALVLALIQEGME